jgi:hypothetical protein
MLQEQREAVDSGTSSINAILLLVSFLPLRNSFSHGELSPLLMRACKIYRPIFTVTGATEFHHFKKITNHRHSPW